MHLLLCGPNAALNPTQGVNFEAAWEEYDRLRQLRGHADHYSRAVAARAFEALLARRILTHADPRWAHAGSLGRSSWTISTLSRHMLVLGHWPSHEVLQLCWHAIESISERGCSAGAALNC